MAIMHEYACILQASAFTGKADYRSDIDLRKRYRCMLVQGDAKKRKLESQRSHFTDRTKSKAKIRSFIHKS